MKPHERVFVPLDTPDRDRALRLVQQLSGAVGGFKIGLELFAACGPDIVREIRERGASVFLDLKLHDIPNTVAGAAAAIARLGIDFYTVHAAGGPEMIRRAVEAAGGAAAEAGTRAPTTLAVTVLTSLNESDLDTVGLVGPTSEAAARLASLARDAGAGGVVCSPLEVEAVRRVFPEGTLMVPGIRPHDGIGSDDDQARTATPGRAVALGANRLVIGRPITRAKDPAAAARGIAREIAQALGD